jgi:glucose-1-phosphate cytidylyltransferase
LYRIREHLKGEEMFLANYSDGLTDMPFETFLDFAREQDKVACFLSVRPTASFHVVRWDSEHLVTDIMPVHSAAHINCGYFVLKQEIFDYMRPGEDLVAEPFHRLIRARQLATYDYSGFWVCADTFKDKMQLDAMVENGDTPWMVWKNGNSPIGPGKGRSA